MKWATGELAVTTLCTPLSLPAPHTRLPAPHTRLTAPHTHTACRDTHRRDHTGLGDLPDHVQGSSEAEEEEGPVPGEPPTEDQGEYQWSPS